MTLADWIQLGVLTIGFLGLLGTALAISFRMGGRFTRLEERVDALGVRIGHLEERVDGLEVRIGALEAGIVGLAARIDRVEVRIGALEAGMVGLAARIDRVEVRIGALEAGMVGLAERIGALEMRSGALEAGMVGLAARIDRLETNLATRINAAGNALRVISEQMEGHLTLIGAFVKVLHKKLTLTDDELEVILAGYSDLSARTSRSLVDMELRGANPLGREEALRLDAYLKKAQRGERFTSEEVVDYNHIVRTLEEQRRDDPRVWPLLGLGAFLSGLFLEKRDRGA